MINGGQFSSSLRNSLLTEVAKTAILLENNLLTPYRDLSPFNNFWEGKEKYFIFSEQSGQKEHHHIPGQLKPG